MYVSLKCGYKLKGQCPLSDVIMYFLGQMNKFIFYKFITIQIVLAMSRTHMML